jgi:exodeoxyribonuclease-3
MLIATWNVNSIRPRLEQLGAWVRTAAPDVLCVQETKVTDDLFPHAELEALGFTHRAIWGQKTYNGVALLSRHPIADVQIGFADPEPSGQSRFIRGTIGGITLLNVYIPNGSEVGSEKFFYKLDWLARLQTELARMDPTTDVLLCGDFNIAPTDADAYDPFETEGTLLCSKPERDALKQLEAWGFVDAWRKKSPFATEYSWWPYTGGGFKKNQGFRIDHIFVTRSLMKRCTAARIDREPRRAEKPSDHAPVIAKFLPA